MGIKDMRIEITREAIDPILGDRGGIYRAMLVQKDDEGVEHAIYYLNKKMLPYEVKYNQAEKTCVTVV